MSKILNVRNSFKKIRTKLEFHDFSCIFFNNYSHLFTTLPDNKYFMSHHGIFDKINTIRCSSITDFSKIEASLIELEGLEGYRGENIVSIIISDGYHTMDNFRSVDYVKDKFNKKFDYSIGIGHEFDSNLLQHISKKFLTKNDNNLFQFLFHYKEKIITLIPKNTFFVCNQKFEKNEEDGNEPEESSVFSSCSTRRTLQKTFSNVMNDQYTKDQKMHFLFIIDTSGSMDDSIYSCLLPNEKKEYDFYYNVFEEDTYIQINHPEVDIYFENSPWMGNENTIMEEHLSDKILATCKTFHCIENHMEEDQKKKMEQLFQLYTRYTKDSEDPTLNSFVKKKYHHLLTPAERRMNFLLHEKISSTSRFDSKLKKKNEFNIGNNCSICLSDVKEILFSCHHVVACFDCVLKLLEPFEAISCPICRSNIEWMRYIKTYDSNQFSCRGCNIYLGDLYQNPCSHVIYCSQCCDSNGYTSCDVCGHGIDLLTKIHFS